VGPSLAALALALAAGSLLWPPLAVAALLVLGPAAAELRGRAAVVFAVAGGLVVLAAVGRFVVRAAVPSLVGMGRHATSERAVSQLREILWAEDRALEERGRKGLPLRYAFLDELVADAGAGAPGVTPPLSARVLQPVDDADPHPTTFRAGGYLMRVYLPARGGGGVAHGEDALDPALDARAWVAFAWPERAERGDRVVFIAEDETICESDVPDAYVGLDHAPPPEAALQGPSLDAPRCGRGQDGAIWRAWKGKKPRARSR
jgi:hypothetical protein